MEFRQFRGKVRRFGRLGVADKLLFLRAVVWLGIARAMIVAIPFRKLSGRMAAEPEGVGDSIDPQLLARIRFAVSAAGNNVPWRSDCFPQCIAARMLLKRYGYGSTIHLGVAQSNLDEISAHAWLSCGDTIVMGGEEMQRYTEMHKIES